jgi:hypothetical protein
MPRPVSTVLALVLGLGLVAGCAEPGGSPSPSGPAGFALRAWITQALPPIDSFPNAAPSLVVDRGLVITAGPVPAIYPGPLMPNHIARPISEAGQHAIVAAARAAGLLDGPADLTGGSMPGAQTGHLLFVIDGVEREVLGDPNRQIVCIRAPCDPSPGTPEAFGAFWARLSDPTGWLGAELGPETRYDPERLAVLLTEPTLDAALPPSFATWPIDGELLKFGTVFAVPQGTPPVRCGVIEGDEVAAALAAFRAANQLTRWTDGTGAERGAVVRSLFPGEPDPCGA